MKGRNDLGHARLPNAFLRNGVIVILLYLNQDEIVRLHSSDLQEEAERFRLAQQVLASRNELLKLNRAHNGARERDSIIQRMMNMGRRML